MTSHKPKQGGLDNPEANGPELLLASHHEQIEAACFDVAAAMYEDDKRELVRRYRVFEHAVLEHLAAEETEILPAYADYDAEDAALIREQHAALRTQLFTLGVEVEVHRMTSQAFQDMVNALHTHAAHEDSRMYPWAQVHLPMTGKRRLYVQIGHSLRALARAREAFTSETSPRVHDQ